MNPQQYYQQQQQQSGHPANAVPPAPPPSPVLPSVDQLDPLFVPAEVMDPHDHLLPEKMRTVQGQPAAKTARERPALAEVTPHPVLPALAPPIVQGATEFVPTPAAAARPLIRTSSAHVFINLTEPTPLATDWEVRPALETIGASSVETPLLPAPLEAMMSAGEGYVIKDAHNGRILTKHTDVVPPSMASNLKE